jgi:hypothetical protein
MIRHGEDPVVRELRLRRWRRRELAGRLAKWSPALIAVAIVLYYSVRVGILAALITLFLLIS